MVNHRMARRRLPVLLAVAGAVVLALAAIAGSAAAAKAKSKTLFVSPRGHNNASCTHKKPCKTIAHAVSVAKPGSTIQVAPGTYREQITVGKRLRILGTGKPTVNAKGKTNGFAVTNGGARSTINNFRVENANESGIVTTNTSHVTISNDTVLNNDRGVNKPSASGFCQAQGQSPGDCGEGIHLVATTHSVVRNDLVQGNSGGILLSDESGPTAFNTINRNRVKGNLLDCGITLAGHNPAAALGGVAVPAAGGVYSNTITSNNVVGNGLRTPGAGIQMAGGPPGAAVYNNLVKGNTVTDNGHPGVTLHSHAPGQDFNGNRVINNKVNRNATHGDDTAGVTQTTGILIFSAVTKLSGIVVSGNTITSDHFGIWTQNVPPISKNANMFKAVAVPLTQK